MSRHDPHQTIADARATAPMPAALADRLRRIPVEVVDCRDVDRLPAGARQRARGRRADPAVTRHLETCARCRQIYAVLQAAMVPAPQSLPSMLRARLRRIIRRPPVRRPPVPRAFFEVDFRLAAAASLFLGLLLQPVASEVAGLTRWTTGQASSVSVRWMDSGARTGGFMWRIGHRTARRGLDSGATAVRAVDRGWDWLRMETEVLVTTSFTTMERLIERQGDKHGNTRQSDD